MSITQIHTPELSTLKGGQEGSEKLSTQTHFRNE
jgi:hypothetical protein